MRISVFKKILCILLCTLCILTVCISFFGAGSTQVSRAHDLPDLSYRHPEDESFTSLTALDLYRLLFEEEPPEAARDYLTYDSRVQFTFSDAVPSALYCARYDGGVLTVEATAHSYIAENGHRVTFVPAKATFGSTVLTLTSEDNIVFKATQAVDENDFDENQTCNIFYKWTVSFDDHFSSYLLNEAFEAGKILFDRQAAYQEALAQYECDAQQYADYQNALSAYYADLSAYNQYLENLSAYRAAKSSYEKYLEEEAQYQAALAIYLRYEEELSLYRAANEQYETYLDLLDTYHADLQLYREIKAERETILSKLYAVESAFVTSELGKMMYATLMGDTVQQVVDSKDTIVKYAGNWNGIPDAIDTADLATKNLRVLLTEYQALTTLDERYAYYTENYVEIKDNFCSLYSSLHHLFGNSVVKRELRTRERYERYKEFIAQLFVISTALDDEATLDIEAKIEDKKIKELIFGDQLLSDTDTADPRATPLPQEKSEPIKPQEVAKPTKPTFVAEPIAPQQVSDPGEEPTVVNKPTLPPAVQKPIKPVSPSFTVEEQILLDAVSDGSLTRKDYDGGVRSIDFYSEVSVLPSVAQYVTVSYYDSDGKTLLYAARLPQGQASHYGGEQPVKESDHRYTYRFRGFFDENGVPFVDGTIFQDDVRVFASYEAIAIDPLTVTFSVDGKLYTTTCYYGEMPQPPTSTDKESDAQYNYVFLGWTPAVSRATADTQYTAVYRREERLYDVCFMIDDRTVFHRELPYGAMPQFEGPPPTHRAGSTHIETFLGWTPRLSPVTEDVVYRAVFSSVPYAYDQTGAAVSVTTEENMLVVANATNTLLNQSLFQYLENTNMSLKISFASGDVIINSDAVRTLNEQQVSLVSLVHRQSEYLFRILKKDGTTAEDLPFGIRVTLDFSDVIQEKGQLFLFNASTKENVLYTIVDNHLTFSLMGSQSISFEYRYTVDYGAQSGGSISGDQTIAPAGTVVHYKPKELYGYRLVGVKVLTESGIEIETKEGAFVMPAENVTVRALFEERVYEVRHQDADGNLLQSRHYSFHEQQSAHPPPPQIDGMIFDGWRMEGDRADGLVIYTARYRTPVYADPNESYRRDYGGWYFRDLILPATLTLLAGGVGIVLALIYRRKRRKKARQRRTQRK